jgi:hypothetical protein
VEDHEVDHILEVKDIVIKNQTREVLHKIGRKIEDPVKEADLGKSHSLTVNLNLPEII